MARKKKVLLTCKSCGVKFSSGKDTEPLCDLCWPVVHRERVIGRFNEWMDDPDAWIGIFENHDLGHPAIGRKFAMAFSMKDFESATVGRTRAPDTDDAGFGWRYILIWKGRDVGEAVLKLLGEERVVTQRQ